MRYRKFHLAGYAILFIIAIQGFVIALSTQAHDSGNPYTVRIAACETHFLGRKSPSKNGVF
jgi:hypothetical protein